MFNGKDTLYFSDELFREHLDINEKIRWIGQPNPKIYFTSADAFLIPISIWVFGFAIFWIIMTVRMNAPLVFPVFGTFFYYLGFINWSDVSGIILDEKSVLTTLSPANVYFRFI